MSELTNLNRVTVSIPKSAKKILETMPTAEALEVIEGISEVACNNNNNNNNNKSLLEEKLLNKLSTLKGEELSKLL